MGKTAFLQMRVSRAIINLRRLASTHSTRHELQNLPLWSHLDRWHFLPIISKQMVTVGQPLYI